MKGLRVEEVVVPTRALGQNDTRRPGQEQTFRFRTGRTPVSGGHLTLNPSPSRLHSSG